MGSTTSETLRAWIGIVLLVVIAGACKSRLEDEDKRKDQTIDGVNDPSSRSPGPSPATITVRTQWEVEWSTLTVELLPGAPVGKSTLGAIFDEDWGKGPVYGQYADGVAFVARARINMPRTGLANFKIGSDDGSKLLVDGRTVIDNWRQGSYKEVSQRVELSPGVHELELQYFENQGHARVSFECDSDLLSWQERAP